MLPSVLPTWMQRIGNLIEKMRFSYFSECIVAGGSVRLCHRSQWKHRKWTQGEFFQTNEWVPCADDRRTGDQRELIHPIDCNFVFFLKFQSHYSAAWLPNRRKALCDRICQQWPVDSMSRIWGVCWKLCNAWLPPIFYRPGMPLICFDFSHCANLYLFFRLTHLDWCANSCYLVSANNSRTKNSGLNRFNWFANWSAASITKVFAK